MILTFVKKQLLLMLRNRQELLVLLGMPLVLISILGFALQGAMDNDVPVVKAKVAWIEHSNEKEDLSLFKEEIEKSPIPKEQLEEILISITELQPVYHLKELLLSEELREHIELVEKDVNDLNNVKNDDEFSAIIEIPKLFSYELLNYIFLNKGERPFINVYKNEGKEISASIVEEVLHSYQTQSSLYTIIGKNGLTENMPYNNIDIQGTIDTVTNKKPLSAMMYYSVGMCVMFVLFVASSIATYTFRERELHVFDRIILGNVSKWSYFFGNYISAIIISFIQIMILYGVSALVYGIYWPNIMAFIVVSLCICLAVGGMAALLTAINFRLNSLMLTSFFGSVLIFVFSFVGGSFFPAGELSPVIQLLGNLTPNGSGMTAYLKILQGYGIRDIMDSLIFLCSFSACMLILAVISFPKRGKAI